MRSRWWPYALTIDWRGAIPRDGTTLAVGRDFLNIWMYGRAAFSADPSQFYNLDAYHAAIRGLLGMEFNGQNWSYPPSILLLAAPFGQLNYFAALAFVAYLLMRLRASPRPSPGARGTLSFKGQGFRWLRLRPGPCRPAPLSYMRLTVAISRAFDRLGVWIGAPSGPSQPAAKRRI